MGSSLKKEKIVKLDLLPDIDMLLTVETSIRGGIHHAIYWYLKTNSKYMRHQKYKIVKHNNKQIIIIIIIIIS